MSTSCGLDQGSLTSGHPGGIAVTWLGMSRRPASGTTRAQGQRTPVARESQLYRAGMLLLRRHVLTEHRVL